MGGIIVGYVPGTGFLIRTHNQLYIFGEWHPQLPDAPHGKQNCYQRSFVIIHASAKDQIPLANQPVGRSIPSCACSNNIQVSQNMESIRAIAQICRAHITIYVFSTKAPGSCQG